MKQVISFPYARADMARGLRLSYRTTGPVAKLAIWRRGVHPSKTELETIINTASRLDIELTESGAKSIDLNPWLGWMWNIEIRDGALYQAGLNQGA